MGTILTLYENRMFRRLWQKDFRVVACTEGSAAAAGGPWVHDCVLDCLAAGIHAARAIDSFVLDPEYARMLDDKQLAIRDALQPLRSLADDPGVRESSSWTMIQRLLSTYGEDSSQLDPSAVGSRLTNSDAAQLHA